MSISKQSGYTLIELMLVLAISGSLLGVAFISQRSLRSQAAFDATINKVVATIADAHNQATAGINTQGDGNGAIPCVGPPAPANRYVFAGVSWNAVDLPAGAQFSIDYYKSLRPGAACTFQSSQNINLPSNVNITLSLGGPAGGTQRVLFVRDAAGGTSVCLDTQALAVTVLPSFSSGTCTVPATGGAAISLYFSDTDNHKSQIQIDPSGLAKRIN